MKTIQNTSCGFTFPVSVPESADEFDRLAGRPGACLDEAISNVTYRGVNHDFRKEMCDALETQLEDFERAFEIKVNEKTGKETKVHTEKELAFINRALADGHATEEELNKIAQQVAATLEFDPSPSKRAKKVDKQIVAMAEGILAAIEAGSTTPDVVKSKIEAKLEIEDFEAQFGEFSQSSLTAALVLDKERAAAKLAAEQAEFASA